MISSPLHKLDNIEVLQLFFSINYNCKYNGIKAEDIDFKFTPLNHKETKTKKRIIFQLKSNKKTLGVSFEIVIGYDYSFFKQKTKREEITIGIFAILPQIISFIRGILFMLSNCTSRPVILPVVDVSNSVRESQKLLIKKLESKPLKRKQKNK